MSSEFNLNDVFRQQKQDGVTKILIVEDDEISSKFLVELLSPYNLNILKAEDGIEAYELFKKHDDIQLVLLDIRLPGLDGYKLAGLFKELRPETPIIAQTAYGLTDDKQRCIDAGCDDYIKKPINIELFYAKVQSYLKVEDFA